MGEKVETNGYSGTGQTWSPPSADPIETPQRSSQSNTQYYTVNDERTIEKRSYQVGSVTAGDTNDDSRYAEWQHVNGAAVPTRIQIGVPSELFSAYNITLDADRASSAATNHALQLGATDLEYEVTRVKSPVIGRDMNPMGRGDGAYYPNGGNYADTANVKISGAKPVFTGMAAYGFGNGVNNTVYDPEECRKLRDEQARQLEEDPLCEKKMHMFPGDSCCIEECGFGLPPEEKQRRSKTCECCCCVAAGCPPCHYPLPKECIRCCEGGIIGEGGKACECTDTSEGDPCGCLPAGRKRTSASLPRSAVDARPLPVIGTWRAFGLRQVPGIQTLREAFKLDKDGGGLPHEIDMGWWWLWQGHPRCPWGYELDKRETKYLGLYRHYFCVLKSEHKTKAGVYCANFCRKAVNMAPYCDDIQANFSNVLSLDAKTQMCFGLCMDACEMLVDNLGIPIPGSYGDELINAVDECCCISKWEPSFGFSPP